MLCRLYCIAACLFVATVATGMETVTFRETVYNARGVASSGPQRTATGRALAKDSQGGMVLQTDEGAIYVIPSDDVVKSKSDDRPFKPVTSDELSERLLAELPGTFRTHTTKHYVIAYDTSREYAEWTSSLLEGLHKALVRYWKREGLDMKKPEFFLPIVIHGSFAAYQAGSRQDGVGPGAVGYYSQKTNRVRMFDLTGSDELRAWASGNSSRRGSRREIQQMLSTPVAEPLVATIVHEATHQVAFNTGVMQRYADLPTWLVEGMAVFFEAPEASSTRGWRGIGKVNYRRLATFRRNLPKWNNTTLLSLIATDKRLRDPRTGGAAYADAWALNYFLIKRRGDAYVAYVKELSEREPLKEAYPNAKGPKAESAARVAKFKEHFGDLEKLQREMMKMMSKL